MTEYNKVGKIRKLADKLGTPLKIADFVGDGVVFYYYINGRVTSRSYANADDGLERELDRLQRFLDVASTI